jgi:hypothetical protein
MTEYKPETETTIDDAGEVESRIGEGYDGVVIHGDGTLYRISTFHKLDSSELDSLESHFGTPFIEV